MKDTFELSCENDFFSARCDGPLVVFRIKGNIFLNLTLLNARESVLAYLDAAAANPEVRILLLLANPRRARREEFLTFFDMVKSARVSKSAVLRLYRCIDEFILHIVHSDLFFINAMCGQILPMNTNISLACDYRIIGDNTVFQNPALELGLVSKGGGAWFLKNTMGKGRLYDHLLGARNYTAEEAVAMGLADQCVPAADLEQEAMAVAQRFLKLPASSLRLAKRFVNHSLDGLAEHLEYENTELLTAMHGNRLLK